MWKLFAVSSVMLYVGFHQNKVFGGSVGNSTACIINGKGHYEVDCKDNKTKTTLDIIAVKNMYFATKTKISNCGSKSNKSECCLVNETTDCIYTGDKHMTDVIRACSGNTVCQTTATSIYNSLNCPDPRRYNMVSKIGIIEYECINIQKLTDMCHEGITKRDSTLYITSNTFHTNTDHVSTTCSCMVTTNCGNTIQINAVDIRLSESCYEELSIKEGSNERNKTITCADKELYGFKPIFTSESNTVYINLIITEKHIGKVWLEVKGIQENSQIELRCGYNTQQPINKDHLCEDIGLPTETVSTPNIISSSVCTDCQETAELATGLSAGVIGGLTAAVVIIVIILIFMLLLVFRSRKKYNDEHIYDTAMDVQDNAIYQTLPEETMTDQATGISNSSCQLDEQTEKDAKDDTVANEDLKHPL